MEANHTRRPAHGLAFELHRRILVALAALILSSPGAAAQTVARTGSSVWLGIALSDSPESSGPRKGPGLSSPGPIVIRVTPGGPMDKAGVRPGDAILEFDGAPTPDESSFGRVLRAIPLGKTVPLRVARGGKVLNLQIAAQSKLQFYRKEADQGDPRAQSELALMYYEGQGAKKDYGEAVKWYRKAAEQGHAPAQHTMGVMHSAGMGVKQDPAAAVGWFRKSAAQGNALAENSLGNSYMQGIGVSKDPAQAVRWYRSAAERGLPEAQHNLAWCYDSGSGVEQNQAEAIQWYAKAADQNYNWSLDALGSKYENGEGVPQSSVKAVEYYRKAAQTGLAPGQKNLARMYEVGSGVAQNHQLAAHWYRRAAKQDDDGAKSALQNMYAKGLAQPPPLPKVAELAVRVTPQKARVRDTLSLELTYTVTTGDESGVAVREKRLLRFENSVLPKFPVEAQAVREDGIYTTAFQQKIPPTAKPGLYLYEAEVCLGSACVSDRVRFEVVK